MVKRGYADSQIIQMWKNKHALVSAKKPKHKNKNDISGVKGLGATSKDENEV